jgi:hypothetical protein
MTPPLSLQARGRRAHDRRGDDMHDILRERVWRKLQVLPQEQVYQVLDYIEFLEARYAREQAREPDAIQKFAERLEDGMRMRSLGPKVISGTVGLLGTARRVLRTVSDAGRDIMSDPQHGSQRSQVSKPAQASGSSQAAPSSQPLPRNGANGEGESTS